MNGLVLKNIYNLKGSLKSIILIIAVFALIFIPQTGVITYIGIMTFVTASWSISTLSMDESVRWDKYALTLPLERKDIVKGKYELLLLLSLAGMAVGAAVSIAANYFTNDVSLEEIALSAVITGSLAIAFVSLAYPIIFKYGSEKGRILMILLIVVPMLLAIFAGQYTENLPDISAGLAVSTVVAASAVVCIATYLISLRIYSKIDL